MNLVPTKRTSQLYQYTPLLSAPGNNNHENLNVGSHLHNYYTNRSATKG